MFSGISAFGAPRRDSGSGGNGGAAGDRSSTAANFGTIRTMTTVATSLGDDAFSQRASMLSDGFGGSVLGEPLQGSPRRASIELPGGPGTAQFIHKQTRDRDRRPSETANIDLSRVIEEGDDAVAAADTGPSGSNGSPSWSQASTAANPAREGQMAGRLPQRVRSTAVAHARDFDQAEALVRWRHFWDVDLSSTEARDRRPARCEQRQL